tara:strand:+ start:334 stop:885 length:552 start_codon:yes stop_codon:yes gene_type:complete
MNDITWNIEDVDLQQNTTEIKPMPKGQYKLACISAQRTESASGNNSYIKADFIILEGEYANWHIFHNFNETPNNAKTAELLYIRIGQQQYKSWGLACNKENETNPNNLIDIPFDAEIDIKIPTKEEIKHRKDNGWATKELGENYISGFLRPKTKKTSVSKKTLATADATSPAESDDDSANPWC